MLLQFSVSFVFLGYFVKVASLVNRRTSSEAKFLWPIRQMIMQDSLCVLLMYLMLSLHCKRAYATDVPISPEHLHLNSAESLT